MDARSRRAGWVVALVLAASAAGCGDDEGGEAATTTAGTGGSPTGAGGAGTGGTGAGGATGSGGDTAAGGAGGSATTSTGTSMGTPCAGNTCDLTFIGNGFTMHDGQTVHAGIVPQGGSGLDWEASAEVVAGAFMLEGPGALQKGQSYQLNYYVDVNGNGECDPTPDDHVWRLSVPVVQESLTITVGHTTDFSNLGCGGFP